MFKFDRVGRNYGSLNLILSWEELWKFDFDIELGRTTEV